VSDSAALVFHLEQGETLRRMEAAGNYNRWLVERGHPEIGRRVLDAGAGIGTFTAAVAEGREVVALEPDPAFVPALRARFAAAPNVEVRNCPVEELDGDASFDTILCFNVLEHIAADEAVLARCGSLLRPGGSLLLLVPAHPAAYGRIDVVLGHERRYRRTELAAKLESAGLEVARLRHVNPVGIAGWLVTSRLLRASQVPSGPLRLYDRLVPVLRLIDRLPMPFGLSLWAVARRPA
jgi:2-polyprenyl-3-methyl-5-hydroxy-6-metoxy-1,4-benzoquinol methylase